MKYAVYGDHGYVSETLLYECDSYNEAVRWTRGYTRRDLGGYDFVEVIELDTETTRWGVRAYHEGEE